MPRYHISTTHEVVDVDADVIQSQGGSIYHFLREHPIAAARRISNVPEDINWDQPQPYYPPILIAMYSNVTRIEIIEE